MHNVNDAPGGSLTISDATPTETQQLSALNAITDADGLTGAVFTYQWQQANVTGVGGGGPGGINFEDIPGATLPTFTPTQAQVDRELRVVVTYTDDQGTTETVSSAATTVVGDFIAANAAAQTLTGNAGDDLILGGGGVDTLNGLAGSDTLDGGAGADVLNGGDGNDDLSGGAAIDTLNGGAGNDIIAGGAGNDVINAGTGNDVIIYTIGDGADAVVGGTSPGVGPANTDVDTLNVIGTAGSDTLNVVFNGTVLTGVGGGTLAEIEIVNADLLAGADTLSYGTGTTAAVSVNLATPSASGFTTIAGIENVTGGGGSDTLTGDALDNALTGGAGNDTLSGGLGNDVLTGGAGIDTASYAGENAAMFIDLATGSARRGSALNPVEDTLVTIENVIGGSGADSIIGSTGANRLQGNGGADANGGAGTDTLDGGDGNDTLVGGTGNDTLIGGDGNDTFTYNFGDGADSVDGGAGLDTLNIIGSATTNILDVIWDGASLTSFEGGTLASVEAVVNLGAARIR